MTTTEIVAIASAIVTVVGGPPAIRAIGKWIADRSKAREDHRHKEVLERIEAEETTGKHEIATIAGLAKVVHAQSSEILILRERERDHDKRCDEKIAAAIKSMRSPGFRPPTGGEGAE